MLFLGMMLGNVLLLDLYNTLGLPTSTTVSMVFGLLGAAVAAALFRIAGDPGTSLQDLSQFINTGKAMVIIAAILLSVALAFVAGTLFMYISRLIFSFRYAAVFRRWAKAARTTRKKCSGSSTSSGAGRGTMRSTEEVTFGAGMKHSGGTSNSNSGAV